MPVIVIGYVPAGVVESVDIEILAVQVGVQEPFVKLAVAPAGKPDALSVLAVGVPETCVLVMLVLPEEPCPTEIFPPLLRVYTLGT